MRLNAALLNEEIPRVAFGLNPFGYSDPMTCMT